MTTKRARIPLAAAVAIASAATAPAALADDTHYHDYPVGGRAVGLGGAFVALGDDPSGIFFNPAGIVDSTRTSVQISTTLYGLEIADSFFAAVEHVTDLESVFTELSVIPTSGSFITSIGEHGPDGRPEQSYGFGAFVPSYRSVNASALSTIPEDELFAPCAQLAYQRHLLDRTYYFGGAYGQRLDQMWRVGISTFLSYRALRDQEQTSCFNDTVDGTSATFATAQTDLDVGVASLVIAAGAKAELADGWFLGATLSTPSMRVFESGKVRVTRGSADPESGSSGFTVRDIAGIDARSEVGASLRAGIAYVVPRRLTFVADTTVTLPARYSLFTISDANQDVRDAITLVSEIERRTTVNLNVGIEYLVSKPFSISGGFFTNFASSPDVPGAPGALFTEGRLPHVNTFGGSFVLGFFSEHTLTRAGLTMSYGSGSDVVPRYAGLAALGQDTQWVKVELSQLFIFFFISSTFRY